MSTHRIPPKPPHFDTAPEGTCRWCGESTGMTLKGKPSKSRWHPKCLLDYKLLFWATTTRRAVWKRDNGVCKECGTQCSRKGKPKWHMDHILPLIEANGNINYWRLENLQTLCVICHKKKTANEASERATVRKTLKEEKNAFI
jgi:hypothetical protein